MPAVSEAFKTYHDFASADLDTIYGERLNQAEKLTLNHAETGVIINDGHGNFQFRALPRLAQLAPTFGVVATHLDGDGKPDLLLAQNFYHPQRETGRMNGSLSLALLGNGDGTFRPLEPSVSGIAIRGDARSATSVDITGNNRPDLLVSRNSDSPQLFINNASGNFRKIRLVSKNNKNRHGVGARLKFHFKDGTTEIQEVQAASGYLSQSTPELFISFSAQNPLEKITVQWPEGDISEHKESSLEQKSKAWVIRR